jgi:hypothetical protein
MSMAEYFFSVKYADRADLFASLSIWKEEKYRQIQGTFGDRYATMSSWNRSSQRMMRFFWNSKSEIQKKERTLEDTVQHALAQITKQDYAAGLRQKGIPEERIRMYGFAFDGKRVLIG